ncbi:hypothetical protein A2U01_0113410, partial [Trifolium medium]|nr:hypothetical protein [Trifolium medium]
SESFTAVYCFVLRRCCPPPTCSARFFCVANHCCCITGHRVSRRFVAGRSVQVVVVVDWSV